MNPVIHRLQNTLFSGYSLGINGANPLGWTFSERIRALGPEFYEKVVSSHVVLNMEHSLLVQQIWTDLLSTEPVDEEQLVNCLVAALLISELLEHVYVFYLDVPREIKRFRAQQRVYRELLKEIKGVVPGESCVPKSEVTVGLSFSQKVRNYTIDINQYRLFFIRSKRMLDLAAALESSTLWFRHVMSTVDYYLDPLLFHIGWFFYVPRLITNLFLLFKHLIPGPWMSEEEKKIAFWVRLQAQLARRWFELANDLIWVVLGVINAFLLSVSGVLVAYLTVGFLGGDIFLAAMRLGIEAGRLCLLYEQYQQYQEELVVQPENKKAIERHLEVLEKQIKFELLRFGAHTLSTLWIFLASFFMTPLFAVNPITPLIGAVFLVLVCLVNFIVNALINHYRPKDTLDIPSEEIKKLGFFAQKNELGKRAENTVKHVFEEESNISFKCSI
jgi:hypothetical protein